MKLQSILLSFLFIVLAGCVSPIGISGNVDMVPTIEPNPRIARIPNELRIAPVSIPREYDSKKDYIVTWASSIRDALARSLAKSQLFSRVSKEENADFALEAHVVAADISKQREFTSMEIRIEVTVRYDIRQTSTGKIIFSESFQSSGGSTTLKGVVATAEARETAIRETIRLLITAVGEHRKDFEL